MRNPLENEEAAFRFVLGTIAYLTPIVVASWISTWLGVVVFVAVTGIVVYRLSRGASRRPPPSTEAAARAAVEDTRRILVIANETLPGERVLDVVVRLADGVAEDVLVVCPVGAQPTRGDADAAAERLRSALGELRAAGIGARGETSDSDPLSALEYTLGSFRADEVVISTFADGRSNWLEEGVVDAVRGRFDGPVTYVVEPGA